MLIVIVWIVMCNLARYCDPIQNLKIKLQSNNMQTKWIMKVLIMLLHIKTKRFELSTHDEWFQDNSTLFFFFIWKKFNHNGVTKTQ